MLPKLDKNPLLPSNHGPISLLETMGKLYEKLLLSQLKTYILPAIRPEKFGFRPQHSTTTHLINVLDKVVGNLNIRHKAAVVFIDIEKAFDRVCHDSLILKLL